MRLNIKIEELTQRQASSIFDDLDQWKGRNSPIQDHSCIEPYNIPKEGRWDHWKLEFRFVDVPATSAFIDYMIKQTDKLGYDMGDTEKLKEELHRLGEEYPALSGEPTRWPARTQEKGSPRKRRR